MAKIESGFIEHRENQATGRRGGVTLAPEAAPFRGGHSEVAIRATVL